MTTSNPMIDASCCSTHPVNADSLHSGSPHSPARAALVAGKWVRQIPQGAESRLMFQRMLAPWAQDVLSLRARGLDRPQRQTDWRLALKPAA
ncbi:MAG: hypothetical protein H6812_02075 [Phycisphaeraceae bacterium]|nr:hypothetical protein [Phycisphaerales bacterium]MCB9842025.1 hypothetical protein [Phycisphaeraceae bacterium]